MNDMFEDFTVSKKDLDDALDIISEKTGLTHEQIFKCLLESYNLFHTEDAPTHTLNPLCEDCDLDPPLCSSCGV